MNSWDLLEVREMVLRDLAEFVPEGYYENLPSYDAITYVRDYKLGEELKFSSKPEHARMTIRQRRASNLLIRLGLCGATETSLPTIEDEVQRKHYEESLVKMKNDLPPLIKSYGECIPEEERKLFSIFTVNDIGQQDSLPDSARTSLLKIVLGIAVKKYKYDSAAKKSAVPGMIKRDLEIVGIKISEETVLAYLREAATRIPFKGA